MEPTKRLELAKKYLNEALVSWEDTVDTFKSQVDGETILTIMVHADSGSSTINFNPLPIVESLIEAFEREAHGIHSNKPEEKKEGKIEFHIRARVPLAIGHMLRICQRYFENSIFWELPHIVKAVDQCSIWRCVGAGGSRDLSGLIEETADAIKERYKEQLGMPPPGRRGLADSRVCDAVRQIGSDATQGKVAKYLEVTQKAVRDWRQARGFKSWEEALARILQTIQEFDQTQAEDRAKVKARSLR